MTELQDCVLIVEDEIMIAMGFAAQIEDLGVRVCGTAGSGETALQMAKIHRPSVVLLDMRLRGEMDGVEIALALKQSLGSKLIFVTGSKEPSTMARMDAVQPSAVLIKPISNGRLKAALELARA